MAAAEIWTVAAGAGAGVGGLAGAGGAGAADPPDFTGGRAEEMGVVDITNLLFCNGASIAISLSASGDHNITRITGNR